MKAERQKKNEEAKEVRRVGGEKAGSELGDEEEICAMS